MKAKTISISAKCSDLCSMRLYAENEEQLGIEHDGYVPNWLFGGGDYIDLDIDLETGLILNWKSPTEDELDETFRISTEEG